MAVAAVAIALAVLQATQTTQALPVAFGVLTVTVGVIGTLLSLYRLIDDPGEVSSPASAPGSACSRSPRSPPAAGARSRTST